MGARRYSDEQRAAMYALYERGYKPAEIARRCEDGLASCAPFEIPRTSVRDIVESMAFERRGAKAPANLAEVEGADSLKDFPEHAARVVKDEFNRIERKQRRGDKPLSLADLSRLAKLERLADQIQRTLRGPIRKPTQPAPNGKNGSGSKESTVERLTREMVEPR